MTVIKVLSNHCHVIHATNQHCTLTQFVTWHCLFTDTAWHDNIASLLTQLIHCLPNDTAKPVTYQHCLPAHYYKSCDIILWLFCMTELSALTLVERLWLFYMTELSVLTLVDRLWLAPLVKRYLTTSACPSWAAI